MVDNSINYRFFLDKLNNGENFSLVRYGDGEFGAMIEDPHIARVIRRRKNERAITFSKKFLDIFNSKPQYFVGIQPLAIRTLGKRISSFYENLENVINGDIFHHMSRDKGIGEFLKSLENKKVIIVGPDYFNKLNFDFQHVVIPTKQVWDYYENIKEEVLDLVDKHITTDLVILYSCSFVAKVLIDDVYNIYKEELTQIDTGALFDPYCGIESRSYHKFVLKRLKNKK